MNLTQASKKLEIKGLNLSQKKALLRNNAQIKKAETALKKELKAEITWYYTKAAGFYPQLFFYLLTADHGKRIADILERGYKRIFQVSVGYMQAQYKNDILDLETKNLKIYTELLQKYLKANLLLKAQSISATSESRVKRIITAQLKDGAGEVEVAKAISKAGKVSVARAALISRTETFDAMNYSQIETARVYKERFNIEKQKKWVAITDNRVRETHLEMNGEEPIGIDEKFIVGGYECDRPHDESLPAEEVINCRCNLVFVNP